MRVSPTLFAISGLATLVVASPHVGMIDLPGHRDVGAIFEKPGFEGASTFLLESKANRECLPLVYGPARVPLGVQIGSIQICTDATCILSTGINCKNESEDDVSVKILGPVDVPDPVELLVNRRTDFRSYLCGKDAEEVVADRTILPNPQEHHQPEVEAQA